MSEQSDGDAAASAGEDVLRVPYHLLLERALPSRVGGEVGRHPELAVSGGHPGARRIQHRAEAIEVDEGKRMVKGGESTDN